MPAYDTIDPKIAGLKQGLDSRVESKRVAEENGIDFGYPVFGYQGNDKDIFRYHNNRAQIVWDAGFVTGNLIDITVDGAAVTQVPWNANQADTIADIVAQIEADITGASAVATDTGGDNRTIQITIEDDGDRVVTETVTGGGSQATGAMTYDSTMIFKGFSMFTQLESAVKTKLDGTVIDTGSAKYVYKDAANVMIDGWITIVTSEAVESTQAAYVIATGADQGKVGVTASGNIALIGATIDETVAAAGLARVRIAK